MILYNNNDLIIIINLLFPISFSYKPLPVYRYKTVFVCLIIVSWSTRLHQLQIYILTNESPNSEGINVSQVFIYFGSHGNHQMH